MLIGAHIFTAGGTYIRRGSSLPGNRMANEAFPGLLLPLRNTMLRYLFSTALLTIIACAGPPSADSIIARAIETHGGPALQNAKVRFQFRTYDYVIRRQGGEYSYQRRYENEGLQVTEVLTNDGIVRAVNGQPVELTTEEMQTISTPLNSVPYFALLPFNLGDQAVQARYFGTSVIKGEPYHEIEVTFRTDGGGLDHEDRFVYWFHQQRYTMDYLAYAFHTGDGGTRFREAFNVRTIGGVRFADYYNYTSDTLGQPGDPIETFDDVFNARNTRLLSEIVLENVLIEPLAADHQ